MHILLIAFAVVVFIGLALGRKASEDAKRIRKVRAVEADEYHGRLTAWHQAWRREMDDAGWIRRGAIADVVAQAPPPPAPGFIETTAFGIPADVQDEIQAEFDRHNRAYEKAQKRRLTPFFDTVEKNPLTDEQIAACICMDDNVQIVAAAGSGKTSTMVAKAGYALHQGLVQPSEILLLAFNRDAAEELGQRVRGRLADVPGIDQVVAKTFNSFGLEVIAEATGKKPSVPGWVGDQKAELATVSRIIEELTASEPAFALDWLMFRSVYGRDLGPMGSHEEPDVYEKGKRGFRADSGHLVKSLEELAIANWLHLHGIEFEYERAYEHETADRHHGQYHPDFYYPAIDLYHEHFALDRQGRAPQDFQGYEEGVAWKRALHAERGTALFETHSHQMRSGDGLRALEAELRKRGLDPKPDGDRPSKASPAIDNEGMARLVRAFHQHVKSNGLDRDQLRAAARTHARDGYAPRIDIFIRLFERIAEAWDARLEADRGVDFDDMLLQAADHIEGGRYSSPFAMVLADEFQDSSRARVRLLKALTRARPDVHLCVVGDDWQGINRFAGADISVMTEFERHFDNATRLSLTTTFRCPQALCDVSSAFIQKNPVQIRKSVRTTNRRDGEVLVAFGFKDMDRAALHLERRLQRLREDRHANPATHPSGPTSVLILGRYNGDRPRRLDLWQRNHQGDLEISFRTVHRSKGLEADYVVLLNAVEKPLGFPSQKQDDSLLQIPMPKPDPFEMAEERRLFYVALTRAKRQMWIYTSLERPSRFLLELVQDGRLEIKAVDGGAAVECPKCRKGVLVVRSGRNRFLGCSRFPACDHTAKLDTAASGPP